MASCFIARPSQFLGAGTALLATAAARISKSSDVGSSSYVFSTPRAAKTAVASIALVSCRKHVKLGWCGKLRRSPQQACWVWNSCEDNGSNSSLLPRAKRKDRGVIERSQQESEEAEEELDEDMQVGLNEISTEALKAMLSEHDREVAEVREKVEYLGEYLVQEKQLDAARFMLVLRGMLDHEVIPQKDDLKGAYKKAFDKLASVIEDSGWVLKQEGADVGGVEMVDDELMPPVLNSQY